MSMLFRMNQPESLVDEIVNALPEELFTNTTTTFCDPAMGKGDYLVGVAKRLLKYGHMRDNILPRLYGFEDQEIYLQNCLRKTPLEGANLEVMSYDDILAGGIAMKFDCVVTNPPYQHPNSPTKKLWERFLAASYEMVTDGGVVASINPTNWMSNKSNMFVDFFTSQQTIKLNIRECERHFPGVDTMIGYSIVVKSPANGSLTTIVDQTGTVDFDLSTIDVLPNHINSLSILTKLGAFNQETPLAFIRSSETGTAKIAKGEPTAACTYPVFRGWAKTKGIMYGYSEVPHRLHDVPKVIFQEFSTDNKGFFVDTIAATENGYMMPTQTIGEAVVLRSVLLSKLYQYAVWQLKHTRTIRPHMLNRLPLVDLTRSWTDEELYAHFNLTQEEIDLIEATV